MPERLGADQQGVIGALERTLLVFALYKEMKKIDEKYEFPALPLITMTRFPCGFEWLRPSVHSFFLQRC